jgi:hypothetical protein
VLCAVDPSYAYLHSYLAHALVDPPVVAERAHIQLVNASRGPADLDDRTINSLRPFGFNLAQPVAESLRPIDKTVILDYTSGTFPATSSWLSGYFGAPVVPVAPATAEGAFEPVLPGAVTDGFVVELGNDFRARFYGSR